eukprot:scaffold6774_cov66-Phaeocystis_antarctica.AAC.5
MIDGEPKPNRVQSLFEPTHGKQVTGDSDSPLTPLDEPQKKRAPEAHAHTHTIYAVRRVLSAGAEWLHPSPVSHRMAPASLAVSEIPHPHPHISSPRSAGSIKPHARGPPPLRQCRWPPHTNCGLWVRAGAIDSAPATSTRALVRLLADVLSLLSADLVVPLATIEEITRYTVLGAAGLACGPVGIRQRGVGRAPHP